MSILSPFRMWQCAACFPNHLSMSVSIAFIGIMPFFGQFIHISQCIRFICCKSSHVQLSQNDPSFYETCCTNGINFRLCSSKKHCNPIKWEPAPIFQFLPNTRSENKQYGAIRMHFTARNSIVRYIYRVTIFTSIYINSSCFHFSYFSIIVSNVNTCKHS